MEKLIEALRRNGAEVIISNSPVEEAKKFKEAFICEAVSAAEDTGVIFFTGEDNRRKAALASHHVAIVWKRDIKKDIISAYIHASTRGEIIFASSGPSKTADIEGKLIFGMHGPKKFTVILEG